MGRKATFKLPSSVHDRRSQADYSTKSSRKSCMHTKVSSSARHCIRMLMLAIAFMAPTWSSCQAIGSFQTKPAFPSVAGADHPPQPPTMKWPNVSTSALIGGCGKGRVSEAQTHYCRGPADIWSNAR